MPELLVSGVREQDVDLLLWEELAASPEFLSWFLAEAGIVDRADLMTVARSINTGNGESDLELDLRFGSDTIKVLVENKVDAPLQPRQAERYSERAATYVKQAKCNSALTVIIAPAAYFGNKEDCLGFDCRVTYESVLEWFERASVLGGRRQCKLALLHEAIEHGRWTMRPDPVATEFWRLYWETASTIAPQLRMAEPGERPATSHFIYFRPFGLAPGVSLIHKLPYGKVDLQFAHKGDRVGEIDRQVGPYLEPDMRVDRAGKSAVVRIKVSRIHMSDPFSTSREAVETGLHAAVRLIGLYKRAVSSTEPA